jgi:homoserine acetyltransferase
MNEQIKELAKQSTVSMGGMQVVDIEKFAELIVRECISIVDEQKALAVEDASKGIKQFFGVEE